MGGRASSPPGSLPSLAINVEGSSKWIEQLAKSLSEFLILYWVEVGRLSSTDWLLVRVQPLHLWLCGRFCESRGFDITRLQAARPELADSVSHDRKTELVWNSRGKRCVSSLSVSWLAQSAFYGRGSSMGIER